MSQETSSEIVEAALSSGGIGYVFKSRIQTDLLPAIESVLAGRKFVSPEPDLRQRIEETNAPVPVRHEVLFYADEAALIESVVGFIARALKADNPAIVIATESHRESFARKLEEDGIDLQIAVQKDMYIPVDAAELLSKIMLDGMPDGARFFNGLSDLAKPALVATKTGHGRIAFFGECVNLLSTEGNTNAAIRLEKLWNVVTKDHENADLLCAYRLGTLEGESQKDVYESICKEHSAVRVQ